jgi:hypothetical protein
MATTTVSCCTRLSLTHRVWNRHADNHYYYYYGGDSRDADASPKPYGAKNHSESQPENGRKLWQAAKTGQLPKVKYLLKIGADLEYRCSEEGTTSLHQAAINGHRGILEALLEAGASVDAGDNSGATALHLASDKSVATALIKVGADVDHEDCAGKTPVQRALERQAMAVVEAIATDHADLDLILTNWSLESKLIIVMVNIQFTRMAGIVPSNYTTEPSTQRSVQDTIRLGRPSNLFSVGFSDAEREA